MDTYADIPRSIAEARSDKSGASKDWTPRDALIAMLRDLDSGKTVAEHIVIVYAVKEGEIAHKTRSYCAGKFSSYECMGLLHDAVTRMHLDGA